MSNARSTAARAAAFLIACTTVACTLVACTTPPPEPVPLTPPAEVARAPVARIPLPDTPAVPPTAVPPRIVIGSVPAGTQYVCVGEPDGNGQRIQTAIQFDAQVAQLCQRHPEMGPCQYERDVCRRSGGRVFTADSSEITLDTEAEYDKKVIRVRFQADDGVPKAAARKKPR